MKRLPVVALAAMFAAVGIVGPAQAEKGKPDKPKKDKPAYCLPRVVGYNASGTLISAQLTPNGETKKNKVRYNGEIQVDVKRANHGAPKGVQTITLKNARVRFGKGVDPAAPAPGSRVKVHGKVTKLPKRCQPEGYTHTLTAKKVDIKKAK